MSANLNVVEIAYLLLGDDTKSILALGDNEVAFKKYLIEAAVHTMFSVDELSFHMSLVCMQPPTFDLAAIALFDMKLYQAILLGSNIVIERLPFISSRTAVYHVCLSALVKTNR